MTSSPLTLADAEATAASFLEARRAKHADFRMDATTGGTDGGTDDGTDGGTHGGTDGGKPEEKTVEEQLSELTSQMEALKQNSRKWEDRAKANKAKADEFDKLQAANATDADKLTAAEKRAAEAERELVRYKVAAETGVPAALLHGNDEDEMREAAKAAIEFRGKQDPKPQPKPDPSQGGSGTKQKRSEREVGLEEARRRFGDRSKKD